LIGLGKEGSVHSRRRAFRILKDRQMVKRLFADIAPRFLDRQGGYTRILKLSERHGDNAMIAFLELTRLPAETPKATNQAAKKDTPAPRPSSAPESAPSGAETVEKPKGFFEGLKKLLRPKDKVGARAS
jgi:large subunit ribosomal protein L17